MGHKEQICGELRITFCTIFYNLLINFFYHQWDVPLMYPNLIIS